MKKKTPKLSLGRETLSHLDPSSIGARGGATVLSCTPTVCLTCNETCRTFCNTCHCTK